MKKLLSILLIAIYSAATMGMSVQQCFCDGKLITISVCLTSNNEGCNMSSKKDDCCKTKSSFFKVKDNHLVALIEKATFKSFLTAALPITTSANTYANIAVNATNGINDPPLLHSSTPTYIFLRTIRV